MSTYQPEFATNRPRATPPENVAGAVSGVLDHLTAASRDAPALAIASAYFNAQGYGLIAGSLDGAGPVRLLLGSEPTDDRVRSTVTSLDVRKANKDPRVAAAVAEHAAKLEEDRDLLGFGRDADELSERLVAWLRRGDVQVRRLDKGFLHGKAFIVDGAAHSVIAGSSNFTYAGLARNAELNLGVYQPSTVAQVAGWFEEQWNQAADYDLAALYEARRVPHDPWLVFLRMLHELYGQNLDVDLKTENELGLSDFQVDGVWRAKRILADRGGVIVADEVGLGKTYVAGELIRQAAIQRRQKVLIVAPAALLPTWDAFLKKWNIPATLYSYNKLIRDLPDAGKASVVLQRVDDYAMVVVDEAHNLRNARTQGADVMRELLSGPVPKDLVLLSATPVNNSLLDLYNLISYITPSDAEFADIDVPSLDAYFKKAMAKDPDDLAGKDLFEVLDAIAVRRTRRFIKTQYPNAQVNGKPIVFPQAVVLGVDYALDKVLPGFFDRFADALGANLDAADVAAGDVAPREPGPALTMARYVPSRYASGEVEQYQVQNAGLLQSALLKRFESSAAAFAATLRTMIRSQDEFLTALDQGYVLTGDALRAWVNSASDDVTELLLELDDEDRENVDHVSGYDVAALREAVTSDRHLLQSLCDEVGTVSWENDPKVAALANELAEIAKQARQNGIGEEDCRNRRKVLVFTYYADTANYINEALATLVETDPRLADYRGRIVVATGADRKERQKAIVGFAPKTAGGNGDDADLYDVAVATDVLSEGVNLQQAGNIINFDLPWNPMRLVQRHGRVDRIGSKHSHIYLRCFFPDDELEVLLKLEEKLQRKLKQASAAFGTSEVLPGSEAVEQVMSETQAEILALRQGDASIFDDASDATASSEEYQRRLATAFKSAITRESVLGLPWGAGTGIVREGGRPGVVFCIRVADHQRPLFRYVPLVTDGTGWRVASETVIVDGNPVMRPRVESQLLTALTQADPRTPGIDPDLPAALHSAVFDAWAAAHERVHAEWMERTDPKSVQPKVPLAMREAANLVRKHGAVLGDRQDALVRRLGQNVETRLQRAVRGVLRTFEGADAECVRALAVLADDLRLTEPKEVEALPEIEPDDIRVICWVAIHPGGDTATAG